MPTPELQPTLNPNQPMQPLPVAQVPPQQPVQTPPQGGKKLPVFIGIFILFMILGGLGFYFFAPKTESQKKAVVEEPKKIAQEVTNETVTGPTPTPMPFRDMTIPYLREQTYSSKLDDLQPAYGGSNYEAFTTSYTSDGLKINGLLTRPTGEAPEGGWPAIVFVHGYIPPNFYQTQGQAYSSYVDYIASNGFVVFKIDLRGHAESEGEPGGAYYSPDYIVDVLNAYSALENAEFVNKQKIGLWGHSMAGNVLMRSWAAKKNVPAIVIWAGAVYTYEDMVKYRITDASFQPQPNNAQRQRRRQEIYEEYGSPSAKVTFWQEVAPVSYLGELNGAIQIHHAVDDDVVSINYSRDLNAFLDKTDLTHEFHEYPSGGHNISGGSFNAAMQRTVEFYNEHLK